MYIYLSGKTCCYGADMVPRVLTLLPMSIEPAAVCKAYKIRSVTHKDKAGLTSFWTP